MDAPSPPRGFAPILPSMLRPILEDVGIAPDRVRPIEDVARATASGDDALLAGVAAGEREPAVLASDVLAAARRALARDGTLLVFLHGERDDPAIARLRDALWPDWHVVALYAPVPHRPVVRRTLEATTTLRFATGARGTLVVARAREHVLAPETTVAKFDQNAAGWNGTPDAPGWRHHRWMRRFVGTFADARAARRILDFGCGAGWVGIEAALRARVNESQPFLAAFDPSPAMVKSFDENARASGLSRFEGRTGFGEAPPFPLPGEEPFDLVISSGVVSFAPDRERWLDGLVSTLARGATLVVGDVQRESAGMRARRAEKPLLPVRELNASTHVEVRAALEKRGLSFVKGCGYQRTRPFAQLLHYDATKLRGKLEPLLVRWNERAARRDLAQRGARPERFDSWVIEMRR